MGEFDSLVRAKRSELRADRKRHVDTMGEMLDKAKRENRSFTSAEVAEYERLETCVRQIDSAIGSKTMDETMGVPSGGVAAKLPEHRYSGNDRVEGREGELLRPDQSMAAWLERRKGKQLAHDVDWNAYWAQRMGLAKPGAELRALGEDTSSGAGAGKAIAPAEWSTSFVDILRPQLVIGRAGVTVMPLEVQLYNLPQYVSDVAPTWLDENATLSLDGNPQFSTIQFNAQGAFTDLTLFSRQLAEDTNQDGGLSGLLQQTIGHKFQRVIDQVAFYGVNGNAGNPGLVNESGLIVQTMGTNGAVPTDTTFLSKAAEAVRVANAEPTAFVANPQTVGTVSRLNASTYAKFWDMPADVADIPWISSTALAANESLGTGSNLSSLYVGDWSRMIIGMRVDLDVQVLKERYADSNQIGLLSYMRFSIRTTHPESFVRVEGIQTS